MTDSAKTKNGRTAYDSLTRSQLIALLKKRDAERKLGLVWERDAIDTDNAIDDNFVVADLIKDQCERPAPWENLVIEGDNYDALRWLRMTHRGKIKCIYIDPPYNTGNKDWVYNDNYVDPNHRYRHSQWLEFLYRRLTLARDLLTTDGVILISINDDNRAKLELMADQALPGMRLGSFVWRTRKGGYDGGNFSKDHDFVLVYSHKTFEFAGSEKQRDDYSNPDNDPRGDWADDPLQQPKNFRERKNGVYFIYNPETDTYYPPNPNRVWSVGQRGSKGLSGPAIEDLQDENLIIFSKPEKFIKYESLQELRFAIKNKTAHKFAHPDLPNLSDWVGKKIGLGSVRIKKFAKDKIGEVNPVSSILDGLQTEHSLSIKVGQTKEGTREVQRIFDDQRFQYPKPVSLIRELIRQSTLRDDTVLDFFAGSSTTAQAVMELNAEDEGQRKFIMVSSTEATSEERDKNICRDVTAERIRRLNANTDKYEDLFAGFAYLRCREIQPLLIDDEVTPEVAWNILEAHHGLPLTAWDEGAPFALHESDGTALVLIDHWREDVQIRLSKLMNNESSLFIYAFEPGQVTGLKTDAVTEIKNVRETLRRLFAA